MSYQKVRFKGVVKEFVTELVEGVEYLFLDDVQDKFPEVTSFSLGLQPAAFLRGKGGGARLTPLRIKAFPNEIIDAEAPQKEVFKSTVPKADNGVWTTFHETLDEMRKLSDYAYHWVAEILENCNSLTELVLECCGAAPSKIGTLCTALRLNTTLTTLDLSGNSAGGDDGAKSVVELLMNNRYLQKINVSSNRISTVGTTCLCEALQGYDTLTELNLVYNNFGFESCKFIADMLSVNSSLKHLNLNNSKIPKEGILTIIRSLKTNKRLKIIDLFQEEAQHLAQVCRENRIIEQIILRLAFDSYEVREFIQEYPVIRDWEKKPY
ncbi:unnamed protein product [Adineta steineri]|uniref:Uncharacterized protein n=1 Tax=Adineta steineri TaxID=433720 RepID=A0A815NR88_9BILA|nr:unnamed protein product [Adineta steineri]